MHAFLGERVAGYKKIREVEFVEVIPRSLAGKILRSEFIERERRLRQKTLWETLESSR